MRVAITRLTIVVTLIGAVLGIVISMYGLYAVWTIKPTLNNNLLELVGLAKRSFEATDGMLDVTSSSLDQAGQDLALMRDILDNTGDTISQSTAMVDEMANLMGERMPQFIEDTQKALDGTQATARLMDDFLSTVSKIPLIGARYTPEVTLGESIANINNSLNPLNESFKGIQNDMVTASASLATVQGELEALSDQIGDIETSIVKAKQEVVEYQLILTNAQDRLDVVERRLPIFVDAASLVLTVFLIWLGISQLGSLLLAFELYRQRVDDQSPALRVVEDDRTLPRE